LTKNDHGRLTLRAIQVFVAVVEAGSFAVGAQRIGASISSVSQQISNLEAALGAQLIDRAARPLALTPAGYVFQRRAVAILHEATRAQTELAELELSHLPQLRLAVTEDLDAEVTPELVVRLAARLEDCTIIAHSGLSHENLAALDSRAVDIVVAADIENPPDWIDRHPLLRDPYILVTAKGLLTEGEEIVAQLMNAPMIRFTAAQLMGRQIEAHLRRLRLAPPRRFELESNHAVMSTVVRARGWTITTPLGYLYAPRYHARLDARPLPFKSFARTVSLYARRDVLGALPGRAAAILRTLIAEHCVEPALADMPWLADRLRILGEEPPPPATLRVVGS
jgi:DNA-binding transcriptional LysR family regulator